MDNNTLLYKFLALAVVVIGMWLLHKHLDHLYRRPEICAKLEARVLELDQHVDRLNSENTSLEVRLDYLKEELRGRGIEVH